MSSALENERRLFYVAITRARKSVTIGTMGKPSRFLEEIQIDRTRPVMTAMQWLASGDSKAAVDLGRSLPTVARFPAFYNNLLSGYLPDLGQVDLIEALKKEVI